MMEKFRWLAAVIAAHPDRQLVGRTRLQKTVRLLQRLGAPLDYDYTMHFYGPYSEGVQADIGLLEKFGLVEERECLSQDGSPYYVLQANDASLTDADRDEIRRYQEAINNMSEAAPIILELAATYDAFRKMGSDRAEALVRLRRKKGQKCEEGRVEKAMELLEAIGLEGD